MFISISNDNYLFLVKKENSEKFGKITYILKNCHTKTHQKVVFLNNIMGVPCKYDGKS